MSINAIKRKNHYTVRSTHHLVCVIHNIQVQLFAFHFKTWFLNAGIDAVFLYFLARVLKFWSLDQTISNDSQNKLLECDKFPKFLENMLNSKDLLIFLDLTHPLIWRCQPWAFADFFGSCSQTCHSLVGVWLYINIL